MGSYEQSGSIMAVLSELSLALVFVPGMGW